VIADGAARFLGALATVTVVRGALVFVAAYAVVTLGRRLRPEARHIVWFAVLAGFLLIPLAWLVLPAVHVGPWIPRAPAADLGVAAAPALSRAEYARLIERTVADTSRALRPHRLPLAEILACALSAWAAGALLLSARIAIGTLRIRALAAEASPHEGLQSAARHLAGTLGVGARVRVLLSPRCSIPFTLGLRRPVVLLPPGAPAWEPARRRAVLLHELSHVRRRDLLVHSLAYGVCILFWFFPPAWLAYAALLREAEAACDQVVVDRGVAAHAYAHDILQLVRGSRGRVVLPATTTALAGPEMIKQRIRSVLALRPGRRPFRPWHAAVVVAVALCCLVPALAVFAAAASPGLPADDPFFGTWVNEEYDRLGPPFTGKAVLTADGRELDYSHIADTVPVSECWNAVEAAWTETGAHWYRNRWVCWAYPSRAGKTEGYSLARISADGSTLESVWAQYGYPEKLNSLGPGYGIMYRQE
jgi:beta-lactamase regulating signal transducer with metallopeptidase domain